MRWIVVTVPTQPEELDSLSAELTQLGVDSFMIEDEQDFQDFLEKNRNYWDYVDDDLRRQYQGLSRITFYLPDDPEGQAQLAHIRTVLCRDLHTAYMEDADWEQNARAQFQPLPIGDTWLIVPEFADTPTGTDTRDRESGRTILHLEPGLSFGTGSHPSTKMCLCALETLDLHGKTALDIGCGSGILSIAALLRGAACVHACDIDPLSPDAARANVHLNHIDASRFLARSGDILQSKALQDALNGQYALVTANIVADVIIALSAFVQRYLAPDGVFICSGIHDERAEDVRQALLSHQFAIEDHRQEEEWHCFVCKRA